MRSDPVEKIIESALDKAGILHEHDHTTNLDFYLPTFGICIEVKQMHTDRIAEQMSRRRDVIAIQGIQAAEAFAAMILAGVVDV